MALTDAPKIVTARMGHDDSYTIERSLATALSDGGMFVVRDDKGGKVLIPAEKVGYVELNGAEQRKIGFGNL